MTVEKSFNFDGDHYYGQAIDGVMTFVYYISEDGKWIEETPNNEHLWGILC